ncbi:MAG: Nramp family divalent metal transporter, partial [Planctomycetota bacterium]|nr:Nramp family divalent metal transporter [Planctomycetota bacterium]
MGPGLITGNFGNDAGGITTYSVAGIEFGLKMLWMVIPVVAILLLYQEMSGRLGAVTGKGLSDLIRENFGVKTAFYVMAGKFLAGIANAAANISGIAAAMWLFGVDKYLSVPLIVLFLWVLTIKANYRRLEKIFLIGILFYGCYVAAGLLAPVDWKEVGHQVVKPSFQFDSKFMMLLVALIGTTLAPWMVFYHQSSVVEKGITVSNYKYFRWEILFAGISVGVVIFFIIVTSSTLHGRVEAHTVADVALALEPLGGKYTTYLFALGLLIASLGASIILPLSTSFSVCEIFGWESGVTKRFMEAPQFYGLFTLQLVIGTVIVLIPDISLIKVMIISQTLNGLLLPVVLVIMLLLINKKKLMGDYRNGLVMNLAAIASTMAISVCAIILVVIGLMGG